MLPDSPTEIAEDDGIQNITSDPADLVTISTESPTGRPSPSQIPVATAPPPVTPTTTIIPSPIEIGSPQTNVTPIISPPPTSISPLPTPQTNSSEIVANEIAQVPSTSFAPTMDPTISAAPSFRPSISPSFRPSVSAVPSVVPSDFPTSIPSLSPSEFPSMSPTYNGSVSEGTQFTQDFNLLGQKFFNESEISLFEFLMANYTSGYEPPESTGRVNTSCEFVKQTAKETPITIVPQTRRLGFTQFSRERNASRTWRSLQQEQENLVNVEYRMIYTSDSANVSDYPSLFEEFINSNLDRVTNDMIMLGIPVSRTFSVSILFSETPSPTLSPQPSVPPTSVPTVSAFPSPLPSPLDTESPTPAHAGSAIPSQLPSTSPSLVPTSKPSAAPQPEENTTIIVVVVVVIASLTMIALFIFYRRRKQLQEQRFESSPSTGMNNKRGDSSMNPGPMEGSWNAAVGKSAQQKSSTHTHDPRTQYSPDGRPPLGAEGLISPSESLISNQSLLSAGNSMAGDSGDEADTTHNLQDEFDQYKDQNLEKMRAEVEGNLSGFDGMMSQALTKALMDDDEVHVDPGELLWGGVGQQRGVEIEASALCEVMDWLKRNDAATIDRKRTFMQEMLNKMVSSVRHGVLGPDDASRAIHECAALLKLQLASDLPVNTVIISGMRKTVTAANVVEAFREFGEIDDAAVASNQRGFGLVRFKTPKSVQRAHDKFVLEEVVVQDVAVQVRIVKEVGRR